MIKNLYSITNIYERFIKPILKEDRGVDAECLTNLSLKLLAFCSSNTDWLVISNYLQDIRNELCITDKNQNLARYLRQYRSYQIQQQDLLD